MTPCYFRDVKAGDIFSYQGEVWVKVINTVYWALGRNVADSFRRSGVNAICPEPTNGESLAVAFLDGSQMVETIC